MCVIAVCENVRLSDKQVTDMYDKNSRGGGAAWRAKENKVPVVKWSKGHTKDQMLELNRKLPFPYVLHFRVPSGGTSLSYLACHPFQIDDDATTGFSGTTTGYVLFHNGFWTNWRNKLEEMAVRGAWQVPSGPWSDSRGLAWAAGKIGMGLLELIDEKVVALGPGDMDLEFFKAEAWDHITNLDENNQKQDIAVSNLTWQSYTPPAANTQQGWHARRHQQGHDTNAKSDKDTTINVNDTRRVKPQKNDGPGGADGSTAATFRSGDAEAGRSATEGKADTGAVEAKDQKAPETTVGIQRSDLGALIRRNQCAGCNKATTVLTQHEHKLYCVHCFDDRRKAKSLLGTCGVCKTQRTSSKREDTQDWICIMCWKTNGRPRAYFETSVGERLQVGHGSE